MNSILLFAYEHWLITLSVLGVVILYFVSCVYIPESKVGVVIKRFAFKNLPPGEIIALHGEAGYQADTLAPGLHFGFWIVQYHIEKVPMVRVPQGELALIVAKTGAAIPPGRILARTVDCDHFQDARAFLK
ncbi:MAG: flotillin family protein, partial [Prosthecobacter sp.]